MFDSYLDEFERNLRASIHRMGEKNQLRDACEYALLSGGKRLRPLFVLLIGKGLGKGNDVMEAALSVEYFHTASLIADDLPCMDNDDERRGKPTLHKTFPESVALLASYTLIALGYEGIYRNGAEVRSEIAIAKALEAASRSAGFEGATHGQFLDLFPPDRALATVEKMIIQKTATLFQLAFAFGWLFGGGNPMLLPQIEEAATHLGIAFQISDDLQDINEDKRVTFCSLMSKEEGIARFEKEMGLYESKMRSLSLWNEEFKEISRKLFLSLELTRN